MCCGIQQNNDKLYKQIGLRDNCEERKGEARKRNPCRRNTDSAISIHVCTRGPLNSTASHYLLKSNVTAICYKRADTSRPVSFTVSAWEWVYATNLSRLQRETSKRHVGEEQSVLITAILLPQRLSCYWGKTMSLRMLTNLRLADLRLTTAQQRSTGQNLPSDLCILISAILKIILFFARMPDR
jgi:hypothetical protein